MSRYHKNTDWFVYQTFMKNEKPRHHDQIYKIFREIY